MKSIYEDYDTDLFYLYKQDIASQKVLSAEEEKVLFTQYHDGSFTARQQIIEANLALVVSRALKYKKEDSHLKFLDLIQEGNLGLIEAVDKFDLSYNQKFSTFAVKHISGAIKRAFTQKEREIRQPEYMYWATKRYHNALAEQEKMGIHFNDSTLCEKIRVKPENLDELKIQESVSISSLNQVIKEEDETELFEMIPNDNTDFDNRTDELAEQELKILLKSILPPMHYFVIYYRYFKDTEEALSFRNLEKYLGISRTTAANIEKKAFQIIKSYLKNHRQEWKKKYQSLKQQNGHKFYDINTNPLHPMQIIQYLYIQNQLTGLEQRILQLQLCGEYKMNREQLARAVHLNISDFQIILKQLQQKVHHLVSDNEFDTFQSYMVQTHKTHLYDIDLLHPQINYYVEFHNYLKKQPIELTNTEERKKRKLKEN